MMWQGLVLPSFRYLVILILGSLMVKRTRNFIFDWAPFLFILLSYDYLRGFVPSLIPQTHFEEMIKTDSWFFKQLPNQILQKSFFIPLTFSGTIFWVPCFTFYTIFYHLVLAFCCGLIIKNILGSLSLVFLFCLMLPGLPICFFRLPHLGWLPNQVMYQK